MNTIQHKASSRSAKAGQPGRDDSINNPTLHIFNGGKVCRLGLYTE